MKPEGECLPEIDSFGCAYLEKDGQERIIIVGGWNGATAEYLNSVYEYNIATNKVSILYEGCAEPREGTFVVRQEPRSPAAVVRLPRTARTCSCSAARTPRTG